MKRVFADWCKTRFWVALAACSVLFGSAHAADTVRFSSVEHATQSPGIAYNGRAPTHYETPSDLTWERVSLPYVLRRPIAGNQTTFLGAESEWTTHWFRMRYALAQEWTEPLAIYLPRVHSPVARYDAYVNGQLLVSLTDAVWNRPVLISIPPALEEQSRDGTLDVVIAMSLQRAGGGAISTVWIGPEAKLTMRAKSRELWQMGLPQITSLSFLLVGVFAWAFWLKRRDDSSYVLFAAMSAVNVVRTVHYYVTDIPSIGMVFQWLSVNSLAWLLLLVNLFALRLHQQRFPRTERVLVVTVLAVSALTLIVPVLGVTTQAMSPFLYLAQIGAGVVVTALTTIGAVRSRPHRGVVAAIAVWLNLLMGAHDWLLQSWLINIESIYLLPYGTMLVMAVFLYCVAQRYLTSMQRTEELASSLEEQLAERSRELEVSHQRLREIEREQAVTLERQRLMREMHDGLGSSLMSSLAMVEQGELDNRSVAQVLRESIDDLKLTIDSLEPMGHDLPTLLGTLRYRLGKRLELAGLQLDWCVNETPPLEWLNPTSALQVLRILQETLTNILKHARATIIRVETEVTAEHVIVRIVDNGIGFDVEAARRSHSGRGLRNLQRRAAILNASIEIRSRPDETVVELELPIRNRLSTE